MDDDTLKIFAYVNISSYRRKAVKSLKKQDKIPSRIAEDSHIRLSHISNVLRELKECGVVECINEQDRRNRVYRLTPLGRSIVNLLD
jgi:DNA-binding MarR family transcriptional regulator